MSKKSRQINVRWSFLQPLGRRIISGFPVCFPWIRGDSFQSVVVRQKILIVHEQAHYVLGIPCWRVLFIAGADKPSSYGRSFTDVGFVNGQRTTPPEWIGCNSRVKGNAVRIKFHTQSFPVGGLAKYAC
jgi:hypothetical protein